MPPSPPELQLLFRPIDLGPVRVRNRLMMTTHGTKLSASRYLAYLEERARGGVGLVGLPAHYGVSVYPTGPGRFIRSYAGDFDAAPPSPVTAEGIAYYDELALPRLRAQAEVVHRHGAVCFGQIHNLGAARNAENFRAAIAPSAVPDDYRGEIPHELDQDEIGELVEAFAQAARRIKQAGLDGVELHAAHGYLIQQFLSPYSNRRDDQYGGSPENRLRLLNEILAAIRSAVGDGFPIGIRISGSEFIDSGLAVEDVRWITQQVADRVVYINVSGGTFTGLKDGVKLPYVSPWYVPQAPLVQFAARLREALGIAVIVAGRINDPVLAERILADGAADMVGMARAFIADPELAKKARDGRIDEVRTCIANNECHVPGRPLVCAINAAAGKEEELRIEPARQQRRVLVVGGGPAGLEAARVAALRGHEVLLYEQAAELGGQLSALARDPNRREFGAYVDYQVRQLRQLGVELCLSSEATPASVAALHPDVVVVATGSKPYVPAVPGIGDPRVITALQVLRGDAEVGANVLVVGDLEYHLPPLTIADFLAQQGKRVEVTSAGLSVGQGIEPSTLHVLTKRLLEREVTLSPHTVLKSVEPRGVTLCDTFTRRERCLEDIDTIVLACGGRANTGLLHALRGTVEHLYAIGDCLAPRRLIHAVLDGARTSVQL